MIQSVDNKLIDYLKYRPKGKIYFSDDFSTVANADSIRKSLSELEKKGVLVRLTQGVYLYPKIDPEFGVLYPAVDEVCQAIARRDKARIIPTGVFALYSLGLSPQIPNNVVYLTDGIPRTIKYRKRMIKFKKTAPKNLAMKGKISRLVISALKEIGKEHITQDFQTQLSKVLKNEPIENITHDIQLAPAWISKFVRSLIK